MERIIAQGLLQHHAVVFRSTDGFVATNHLIFAEKGSPLLLHALKSARRFNVRMFLPYLQVFYSTGPIFWHLMIQEFASNPALCPQGAGECEVRVVSLVLVGRCSDRIPSCAGAAGAGAGGLAGGRGRGAPGRSILAGGGRPVLQL